METGDSRGHNRGHKRNPFAVTAVLLFVLGIIVATMQSSTASQTKEREVKLASISETDRAGIPPIDASAPSMVKTASFGLG